MKFSKRMDLLAEGVFSRLDEEKQNMLASGKAVYDFTIGSPNIAPSKEVMDALITAAQQPESYMYSLHDTKELKETILTPMPHLITYLKYLKEKDMTIVLASSSDMHWINTVLDGIHVREYFDIIISGENLKHSKPDPEIFYLAAKQAGCKHDECMVIEDSVNGIKAGKAADMYVIGYKGSIIQQDTSKADKEIYNFCELYT